MSIPQPEITPESPPPSQQAVELIQGAYDTHVHLGPDAVKRESLDFEAARRFQDLGFAGMVLKSHYVPTAERAEVARALVPGFDTRGALALNQTIGGLNPLAVEIAGREGAAIVWLPTVDAENETAGRDPIPTDRPVPVWALLQHDLRDRGFDTPPVPVVDSSGQVLDELRDVLRLMAEHDLALATSHLNRDEIFAVVDAANDAGVTRIIITHPEFPSQSLSLADQQALAAMGGLLERCFTTPNTGKVSWERMLDNIRGCGAEASFLSSDLGQEGAVKAEFGIPYFAERLLAEGFSEAEVRTMAVTNTRRLVNSVEEA